MREAHKQQLEALRIENGIKSMYFTRYLAVRYTVALVLFVNLFWALMVGMSHITSGLPLPLIMSILSGIAMFEQALMNTPNQKKARISQMLFKVNILVNAFVLSLLGLNNYQWLFPYLKMNSQTVVVLLVIQIIGVLLSSLMLRKMSLIDKKADRQYYRIERYLAATAK